MYVLSLADFHNLNSLLSGRSNIGILCEEAHDTFDGGQCAPARVYRAAGGSGILDTHHLDSTPESCCCSNIVISGIVRFPYNVLYNTIKKISLAEEKQIRENSPNTEVLELVLPLANKLAELTLYK